MQRVCRTIEKIAPSDVSVLLLGESGTGKEVLAQALHVHGRRPGQFIAINCAAIPENLLESELFGHEKGAFTGAIRQVKGKVELAHRGTLLLDEIGDMPMALQAKLLRFLQERRIERVGGRESIPVDVRVVAATNRDLAARIRSELFREDLYYRIAEVSVDIPPLRERDEDPILLARHFIALSADGGKRLRLSGEAVEALSAHPWPGNVRELVSRIKRACILAEEGVITPADLGLVEGPGGASVRRLREVRDQAERSALLRALEAAGDNLSGAARLLGISRPTLYDLLRSHNIRTPAGERADVAELAEAE
jgi:two-component system NtrC family response regulator